MRRAMRKMVPVLIVTISILILEGAAKAQQPPKMPRIGILGSSSASGGERSKAIREAMRELGYVDGRNISFEDRYLEGAPNRAPAR